MRRALASAVSLALVLLAGCVIGSDVEGDLDKVRVVDEYPLYWVGERFESWDVSHVAHRPPGFATIVYGRCDPGGGLNGGCAPPMQIQVSPLCNHLDVVARNRIWTKRSVRGAPVGTIDSAPVLFTSRSQVKVYRGEGSDPGLELRVLRALRSLNRVEPRIGPTGPIPGPAPGVLEGTAPCA